MALETQFTGIDADAIGQGDDDETLTVDTWLQRRIQYNNEALLCPPVGICYSPISGSSYDFTTYAGIRPYCAFHWHSVWRGDIYMYRDQTHVSVTLAYHSDTPENAGTQAGITYARILFGDGSDNGQAGTALAATYSSGVVTGHQTITVKLTEPIRQAGVRRMTIMVRSASTSAVTTVIGTSTDIYHQHPYRLRESNADTFFDPNSAGTPPDSDSLECMYVLQGSHTDWPSGATGKYDLLWTADLTTGGTIAGTYQEVIAGASTIQSQASAYLHNCFFLRALFVEPVFQSLTSPSPGSAVQPAAKFAPIVGFGGAEAQLQAAQVHTAYRQPSIAAIGPRGKFHDTAYAEDDLDRFAANGYAAHWPTINGDFTNTLSNGDSTAMINEGFSLRTENPVVELRCTWLSVQHGAPWNQNQTASGDAFQNDGSTSTGDGSEGRYDKTDTVQNSGAGAAEWTMTVAIEQLTDAASGTGDWDSDVTSYGGWTETFSIPVYGADVVGGLTQPPVLRGIDSMEQSGKSDTTRPGFWFKEGSLFGEDIAARVLFEKSTTIQLSGLTQTEVLRPFRLKVNMNLGGNGFYDPVKLGDNAAGLKADLRLTLVSYTLIERPQKP